MSFKLSQLQTNTCGFVWKYVNYPKLGIWFYNLHIYIYIYIGFLIQCLGILFHFSTNPSGLWHVLPQCFRPWSHLCILLVAGLASATLICRRPRKKKLMIIGIFGSNPVKTTNNHHVHLCLGNVLACFDMQWVSAIAASQFQNNLVTGSLVTPGNDLPPPGHSLRDLSGILSRHADSCRIEVPAPALSTCWDHVVCRCCTYPLVNVYITMENHHV